MPWSLHDGQCEYLPNSSELYPYMSLIFPLMRVMWNTKQKNAIKSNMLMEHESLEKVWHMASPQTFKRIPRWICMEAS